MRQEPTEIEAKYTATNAIPTRLSLFAILNVLEDVTFCTTRGLQTFDRTYLTPMMTCEIIVCITTAWSIES